MLNNRRNFIKSFGFLAGTGLLPLSAQASSFSFGKIQFSNETRLLLGTYVNIQASNIEKDILAEAFEKSFEEVARLESIFTRHSSSALTALNEYKKISNAPQEFIEVVHEVNFIEDKTNSMFNPSILPVLEYAENTNNFSKKEIESLLKQVESKSLSVSNSNILLAENARVTLDGIAKGYIVDKVAAILDSYQIQDFIINAGGDIRAKGMKNPSLLFAKSWSAAIEDPAKQGQYPAVFPLYNKALATSGSYEKSFANNMHHIINPHYSMASSDTVSPMIKSVSVIADTAIRADALATALSCMPTKMALDFVNKDAALSCFIITADDAIYTSKNWV